MAQLEPVVLILVRHAEQERAGLDGPLTVRGREQANALAGAYPLDPRDRLVCSPLLRAQQTAAAFAHRSETTDDLEEYRFGPSWTWPRADDGEDLTLWRPEHHAGNESLADFQHRVQRVLEDVIAEPPQGRIVMCTHSGVIDAILRWAFGATAETPWTTEAAVGHASVTELRHWPRGRHQSGAPRHTLLVRLGDVAHLPAGLVTGR